VSQFKINLNRAVHELNEVFRAKEFPIHQNKDVKGILDFNHDGKLTPSDFSSVNPRQFAKIESLLKKHGIELKKLVQMPEISYSEFQNYYPASEEDKYTLDDAYFQKYFTESADDKKHSIKNAAKFKKLILETASELGYAEKDISNMSIHDAIRLSGMIVAHKLEYEHGMISDAEKETIDSIDKKDPDYKMKLLSAIVSAGDQRNDLAQNIDAMSVDEIFEKGRAICRNYATVNAGVFEILKEINPNLKNTYMTVFSPDGDHSLMLPHAWNKVSTLTADDIKVTYVDSTWLDTRSRSPRNDELAVSAIKDDMSFYNAYDESHFGVGLWRIAEYESNLYEDAGSTDREISVTPEGYEETSGVALKFYAEKGVEIEIQNLRNLLDKKHHQLSDDEKKYVATKVGDLFSVMYRTSVSTWIKLIKDESVHKEVKRAFKLISPKTLKAFKDLYKSLDEKIPDIVNCQVKSIGSPQIYTLKQLYESFSLFE